MPGSVLIAGGMSEDFTLSDEQADLLEECRREGLMRSVLYLSKMSVNWEEMLWAAAGDATSLVANNISYGKSGPSASHSVPGRGLGDIVSLKVANQIKDFLTKILDAVRAKLLKNIWVQRMLRVMRLGMDFLVGWLRKVIMSKEIIGAFIPFYDQIKGLVASGAALEKLVHSSRTVDLLERSSPLIGEGIPSTALKGFTSFLDTEALLDGTNAVYQFNKTLAIMIVQIMTAGAATVLVVVTKVVEVITSWIYKFYLAWSFNEACKRCQWWTQVGGTLEDLEDEFTTICAGCPLLGVFLFSIADHIGTINLSSIYARRGRSIPESSVWTVGSAIYEIQVRACQYIETVGFKPKIRSGNEEEQYGHIITGISKIASNARSAPDRKPSKKKRVWNLVKRIFS